MTSVTPLPAAPRAWSVEGTAKVVRFNWPKYIVVAALLIVGVVAAARSWPGLMVAVVAIPAGLGLLWSVTSLVATWWTYDHTQVYDHVAAGLGPVGRWATVHAGFDDATPHLATMVAQRPEAIVDVCQPGRASLRRAQAQGSGERAARRAARTPGDLGLADASLDTVFLTFAAHEIRERAAQRALFAELRRTLAPGGRLVITEHLRDLRNAAVYGPAAWHFQPAATWLARADEQGLVLEQDTTITPWVHRMVWHR